MPTNKELADDIHAIQPDIDVTGMNNKDLAALLKDLRAAQEFSTPSPLDLSAPKASDSDPDEDNDPDLDDEDNDPDPARPALNYVVVDGCSITSRRGMINGGKPISSDDLSGGEEALKVLIAKGFVNELKTTSGA